MTVQNKIDHIVIGADSLEQGIEALQQSLDATLPKGSKHDAMSTHNCVAPVGNESFIEILSIDPDVPAPDRARWFDMDNSAVQAKFKQAASAHCWVVGTSDLDALIASSPVDLGEVVFFSRGERSWRLTIPKDGSLLEEGLIPSFIEWSPGPHPSTGMADLGLELQQVVLTHPDPEGLKATLTKLGVDHLATVESGDKKAIAFNMKKQNGELVTLK